MSVVDPLHGGAVRVPRSRGAVSGVLLIVFGVWGALVPLVGPEFSFGLSPDTSWHWTAARFWLEVLPGAVTVVGGLMLLFAANRITASAGAWLGAAGGAWFVVGRDLADLLGVGSPGSPSGSSKALRALESLACFAGLGAAVVFVSATAWGRLSVRSVRDVRAARRREAEADAEQRRQQASQQARLRERDEQEPDGAPRTSAAGTARHRRRRRSPSPISTRCAPRRRRRPPHRGSRCTAALRRPQSTPRTKTALRRGPRPVRGLRRGPAQGRGPRRAGVPGRGARPGGESSAEFMRGRARPGGER